MEYTFNVAVKGEPLGSMATLAVVFDWPYEVSNGKWLLYLTEIVTKGTAESHCVPKGDIVNPLNLTLPSRGSHRRRREADLSQGLEAGSTLPTSKKGKITVSLDCSQKTANCITFSCPLLNMTNKATVIVRARVWNSTLLEDYSEVGRVTVKAKATLKLDTKKPTIEMTETTHPIILEVDSEILEEAPQDIALWIIIVAVVAGILLLGLIILLLWKCGFFKRASRREMYEAKGQKAEMKIQPSETERLTDDY